jgi:hypothetical protein
MGAILLVLAARARRYWRSWLLLGLVAAIGTGIVLAALTAGRRADSAFPRFAASHGYDAIVYSVQPLPKLGTLREVSQVTPIRAPFHGQPWCSCGRQINQGDFAIREVPAAALGRVVKLVSGRMPDQASVHETLASFTLQRDYGIGPGTVIRIPMAGASQRGAVLKALAGDPVPKPAGPTISLRVVGVAAAESEFPSGQGPVYDLYPTQAFATATRGSPALPFYYVQLRHGEADFARSRRRPADGTDPGSRISMRRRRRSRPRSAPRPSAGGCSLRSRRWSQPSSRPRRWPGRPPRRTPTSRPCPRWA